PRRVTRPLGFFPVRSGIPGDGRAKRPSPIVAGRAGCHLKRDCASAIMGRSPRPRTRARPDIAEPHPMSHRGPKRNRRPRRVPPPSPAVPPDVDPGPVPGRSPSIRPRRLDDRLAAILRGLPAIPDPTADPAAAADPLALGPWGAALG